MLSIGINFSGDLYPCLLSSYPMQKEIEILRRKFCDGRLELFREVTWTSPSRDLLEAHTNLIDTLINEIYRISIRDANSRVTRTDHSGLVIVATGGYGRRELNPYSDVDIAFIPSEEEDPWVEAVVHTAFKLVMDVFYSLKDVQVGYSFRPVAEASAWDVSVKTSLLDLRYVCGDISLAEKLKLRVREVLSPLDLMLEGIPDANSGRKPARSLYSVEPNLKEGPGSLRDLHSGRWIFKLLLGVEDRELESALVRRDVLSYYRIAEVREAADWFWRARTWLHLAAGRRSDVLITNYQDRIARELGDCSAQTWLSKHLMYAEILSEFRKAAVEALLQGPLDMNETRLEAGALHFSDSPSDPGAVIAAFHLSQRYSIPLSSEDRNRLSESRRQASRVREPAAREARMFMQILGENRAVAATLRTLAGFGLADRFIPHFSEMMRYVPPDPAHSYTVGEHSIRMIEHLETLRAGRDPNGQRFTEILDQCPHFDMLCLAALLHDAGKLLPGDEHSESGAESARTVTEKLNLPSEKIEILDILIRQHLLLVRTARLHDLTSANVIQRVVERVSSVEALRHLYVFTYVDTCAVAEKNWTSMDVRDLEDLYGKMQEYFARTLEDAPDGPAPEERIGLIRKRLAALQPSENEAAVMKHCNTMPASYLLNTSLEEIAGHLELLERLESDSVVFDVYNRPGDDYTELTICTPDDSRPGMLAKITGVLYGCAIDIHKARAYTMEKKNPVVLDTLWIRSNGMQISETKARRIQAALKEVLTGVQTLERFLEKSGKIPPERIILDSIDLRNDLSEEHTVVHIVADDLQGLLYVMSRSLSRSGLHIHSAKIATWQARAENNFYVTTEAGGQIPDSELPIWTDRLRHALQGSRERD
jgi:[protein-PII] uridylyltransferase